MDGQEQVGLLLVGDGRPGLERNEGVVGARVDDFRVQAFLDQPADAQRDVEDQVLFEQALDSFGALVVPAVAGVDDDAADLEAEGAGQGGGAGRGVPGAFGCFDLPW